MTSALSLPKHLEQELHPGKNPTVDVTLLSRWSHKKIWWLCAEGHEWEAQVANRSSGGGCPYCSNKKVLEGFNDLTTLNPELAKEWHPTKNNFLKPEHFTLKSGKKVWWAGPCGHEWEAQIEKRSRKQGCPYCSNKKLLEGFNDFKSLYPSLAYEWNFAKNDILPSQILSGSHKKVWWLCSLGHEWEAAIKHRTFSKSACPVCAGQRVHLGFNDLLSLEPAVALQWHPTKNGLLEPISFTKATHKKAWWLCAEGHEWEAAISDRTRKDNGSGCPVCHPNSSAAEKEIVDYLINALGLKVLTSTRTILAGKELDIYLPDHKIAIEYNGVYWHSEDFGKDSQYHYAKWRECKELGIQLIQIWEDDWNLNKELVLISLKYKFKKANLAKIYARKTKVISISHSLAESFLEKNHIQGFSTGSYYLGLVNPDKESLHAVLVLKKEPGTDGKTLNIIRYATNANVIGGFTKLLAYATRTYSPQRYITFSDHCISDGGLYENNGFMADKELAPDYMYVVKGKRKHKFGYRLKRFKNDPELLWKEGLTEKELAKLNKIPRIWDAGKTRWIKIL